MLEIVIVDQIVAPARIGAFHVTVACGALHIRVPNALIDTLQANAVEGVGPGALNVAGVLQIVRDAS